MSPHSGAKRRTRGEPAPLRRTPSSSERWADILAGLGIGWDTIVRLKVRSVAG